MQILHAFFFFNFLYRNAFFTISYSCYNYLPLGYGQNNRCIKTSTGRFIRNRIDINETSGIIVGRAHWECEDYCYGCKFRLSNVGLSNCHDYRSDIKVIFTRSIDEIKTEEALSHSNFKIIYMSVGCVVLALIIVASFVYYKKTQTQNKTQNQNMIPNLSDVKESLKTYGHKFAKLLSNNAGFRFLAWKTETEPWRKRVQDIIQNVMLVVNAAMAVLFAEKWSSDDNPLLIINNKFRTSFSFSDNASNVQEIIETKHVDEFVELLNFWVYLVNIFNAVVAIIIITSWIFTKTGDRSTWIKLRLLNACSMLGSIFIVLGMNFDKILQIFDIFLVKLYMCMQWLISRNIYIRFQPLLYLQRTLKI